MSGNIFPSSPPLLAQVINGITQQLGSNTWQAYPNSRWVDQQFSEEENFGQYAQPPTARWPNGYYQFPFGFGLLTTGDVVFTKPIVPTPGFGVTAGFYAPAQGLGTLRWAGGTGAGPIDIGYDL